MKQVKLKLKELEHLNNNKLHEYLAHSTKNQPRIYILITEKSVASNRILFENKNF